MGDETAVPDEETASEESAPSDIPTVAGQSPRSIVADVARLRDRGFVTAAERPDLMVAGLVVAFAAILSTAVGGWLYLKIDDFGAIPGGRLLFREVIAGSVLMFVLWLAWVLIVEAVLKRRGSEPDRRTLGRTMGFACAPLAVSLLMVIPIFAFGAGLVGIAMWVVATDRAIAAAVPDAAASDRRVANLAGFATLALVLGAIAFKTGMAPGPFVFVGLWELLR